MTGDTDIEWTEGAVDASREHMKLTYGDIRKDEDPAVVACVAREDEETGTFVVEFVRAVTDEVMEAVRKELDFYLLEVGGYDPWAYAKYHCTTASNIYSKVHWEYYPEGYGEKGAGR